jgi:hypothetical protein
MAQGPWFRRRTRGFGWTPITWQGWLVTLGPAAVLMVLDLALVAHFAGPRR